MIKHYADLTAIFQAELLVRAKYLANRRKRYKHTPEDVEKAFKSMFKGIRWHRKEIEKTLKLFGMNMKKNII